MIVLHKIDSSALLGGGDPDVSHTGKWTFIDTTFQICCPTCSRWFSLGCRKINEEGVVQSIVDHDCGFRDHVTLE